MSCARPGAVVEIPVNVAGQPLPDARHRLDRDDLAAMATSARVSLSVPAAMSTTLRPGRRSSRSASHRPASSE